MAARYKVAADVSRLHFSAAFSNEYGADSRRAATRKGFLNGLPGGPAPRLRGHDDQLRRSMQVTDRSTQGQVVAFVSGNHHNCERCDLDYDAIMIRGFQVKREDNVAALLDECAAGGNLIVIGGMPGEVRALEPIPYGHKIALADIPEGGPVVKWGVRIGHATQPIPRGAWVHLHNLASDLDARSSTLDLHSGAPTDTSSAYV